MTCAPLIWGHAALEYDAKSVQNIGLRFVVVQFVGLKVDEEKLRLILS